MFSFEIVNSLTKPPSPFRFSLLGRQKGRVSLARFDPRCQTVERRGRGREGAAPRLETRSFCGRLDKRGYPETRLFRHDARERCLRNAVSLKRAKTRSFLSTRSVLPNQPARRQSDFSTARKVTVSSPFLPIYAPSPNPIQPIEKKRRNDRSIFRLSNASRTEGRGGKVEREREIGNDSRRSLGSTVIRR